MSSGHLPLISLKVYVPFFGYACAHVAQAVEHVLGKDEVTGSSPVVGLRVSKEGKKAKQILSAGEKQNVEGKI